MREPIAIPNIQLHSSLSQSRVGERLIPRKPKPAQSPHVTGVKHNEWIHPQTPIPFHRLTKLNARISELEVIIGDKPDNWRKPNYGHLDYTIAHRMGWISDEDEAFDRKRYEQRRVQSLQHCHTSNPGRYGRIKQWSFDFITEIDTIERNEPAQSGAYIPEMNAAVLQDHDLTDGAKICLAKLLEETYRNNRAGRWLATTVPYLMQALGRSRRTIQNYLRLLERCGYIACDVLLSDKTRMTNGLYIALNKTTFAQHHEDQWPEQRERKTATNLENSGAQNVSPNYFSQIYKQINIPRMPVSLWAAQSMMVIYKRFVQNNAPYTPPDIQI